MQACWDMDPDHRPCFADIALWYGDLLHDSVRTVSFAFILVIYITYVMIRIDTTKNVYLCMYDLFGKN